MNRWIAIAFTLLIASCGGGGGGSGSDDTSAADAKVGLILTDAPSGDYTRAMITFTKVELVGDQGKVTLFSGEETFDLLSLPDFYEFLDTTDVPAGKYSSLRITTSDVNLYEDDGAGGETEVPSKLPSKVIKVVNQGGFTVTPGSVLFIEIDFDMNKALKFTTTGQGKVIIRPVVFANIRSEIPNNKFVRVHGDIESVGDNAFSLCRTQFITDTSATPATSSEDCMRVRMDEDTGIFASNGLPAEASSLVEGDEVTVIGRLVRTVATSPDIDDANLPEEGYCIVWYLDRSVEEQPAAQLCSTITAVPEGAVLVNSQGVVDAHIFAINALTIEEGLLTAFRRYSGEAASTVDVDTSRFDVALDEGQGIATDSPIAVQLFPKTRVFNDAGTELTQADIQVGLNALIDAVLVLPSGEDNYLRSPFLVLSENDEEAGVSGELLSVDGDNLRLTVSGDAGDQCVDAAGANIYLVVTSGDETTKMSAAFSDLAAGDTLDIFGEEDIADGCFNAETIFIY
ncbi:DUF4382 domain-containing protein [Hahella sp. CR1]|uniref:DUF4382 domain-containing protein n=1 Tax=Hahella sp. CR1 TaxID=2992807 RepID=UPI0024410596|nr:DUF4382 domain-containing protein [Hahella sp. CR1]MDG9671303.1 DUF4382 domain-containing protein [Hahella sp. CR1]